MAFDLDPNYKDVPARIADFKAKHPDGSLREHRPWQLVTVADQTFVAYTAAAYRTPDDPAPGIGTAWELVPGKTPYTKLSELQNAETSAWGRAIVAALASESKSVASAEDVRNRQAERDEPQAQDGPLPVDVLARFVAVCEEHGIDADDRKALAWDVTGQRTDDPKQVLLSEKQALTNAYKALAAQRAKSAPSTAGASAGTPDPVAAVDGREARPAPDLPASTETRLPV